MKPPVRIKLTRFFLLLAVILFPLSPAAQPLRVHPANPRYFMDETGKAVYLTGSHYWSNAPTTYQKWQHYWQYRAEYNFEDYLNFMIANNQNFTRLWALGVFHGPAGSEFPTPYLRTGPGLAHDGQSKFDLTRLDQRYYDLLRSMVQAAKDKGIYVDIMLFEGWWLHGRPNDHWPDHPYNPANNINDLDLSLEQIHTLENSALVAIQEQYIRKVVDTVNDLDNVLFEIANEDGLGSREWSYHWVNFIKNYESTKPYQHPVGMTYRYQEYGPDNIAEKNQELFDSNADWVSPKEQSPTAETADGRKVSILDTDHICPFQPDKNCGPGFIWQAFLHGHNPIIMDVAGTGNGSAGLEKFRRDSGHTRRFAERMDLVAMVPSDNLVTKGPGYCLASDREYLVYLPNGGSVTIDLHNTEGTVSVEWFNPVNGESSSASSVTGGVSQEFTSPYSGESVLYLKKE